MPSPLRLRTLARRAGVLLLASIAAAFAAERPRLAVFTDIGGDPLAAMP